MFFASGWWRDGPGRAPAGRRRHLLPHRLPGLFGERAAHSCPGFPALGAETRGSPLGGRVEPRALLTVCPGARRQTLELCLLEAPAAWALGESRGYRIGSRGGQLGPFLGEPHLGSPQRRRIPSPVDRLPLVNNAEKTGLGGAPIPRAVRQACCPAPSSSPEPGSLSYLPCPSPSCAVSVPARTPEVECQDPEKTLLWLGLGS